MMGSKSTRHNGFEGMGENVADYSKQNGWVQFECICKSDSGGRTIGLEVDVVC